MGKVEIIKLDHHGRGLGKINEKVIFIEKTLPQELVIFNMSKDNKNYCEGKLVNIINESKERVIPKCSYYDKCGGCDLLHCNYYYQLFFKEEKVKNIIYKYVDNNIKINKIIDSDKIFNYRNKVIFHVNKKIGFYKRKSNNIVYIDKCMLINEKINNLIPNLNKLDLDNINSITCRTNDKDLMIIIDYKKIPDKNKVLKLFKNKCNSIVIKLKDKFICLTEIDYLINQIGNKKFYLKNDGFFQINNDITFKIYCKIKEYANLSGKEVVLDLYCGSGTIGIFLSDSCKKVIGVEINKYSIECANLNKILNNSNNLEFILSDVNNLDIDINPDIVIVDPPRNGLCKEVINKLNDFKAEKIIYVSCNPMTLARDLKILQEKYIIKEITPFDMFPNTYHVECVCLLKLG